MSENVRRFWVHPANAHESYDGDVVPPHCVSIVQASVHDAAEARAREAEERADHLESEARIHAQEALTANATIAEIYQVCSGGRGEPGNWHGAAPVRALKAERDKLAATVERVKALFDTRSYTFSREQIQTALAETGEGNITDKAGSIRAESAPYAEPGAVNTVALVGATAPAASTTPSQVGVERRGKEPQSHMVQLHGLGWIYARGPSRTLHANQRKSGR